MQKETKIFGTGSTKTISCNLFFQVLLNYLSIAFILKTLLYFDRWHCQCNLAVMSKIKSHCDSKNLTFYENQNCAQQVLVPPALPSVTVDPHFTKGLWAHDWNYVKTCCSHWKLTVQSGHSFHMSAVMMVYRKLWPNLCFFQDIFFSFYKIWIMSL